ncbi:MAG: 3'(2'),5'-bisphosphate nucleotidase CysQ [Paracoccaceae bacterium]
MPGNDLTLLIDAARKAGDIARSFWQHSPEVWEKPDGTGPVTQADLAVNAMLQETLRAARPDYGWLSEESEDSTARLSCDRVFIIDPIDGTRSFIAGEKTWAHSLAIAENGEIIAGVVFVPMLDRMYHAHQGGPACLNGAPIRHSATTSLNGATVLGAKSNLDAAHWQGDPPPLKREFRPSLAYRMALVAQGRFDAMLSLRDTWEWDVAAGTLIAVQAGAQVSTRAGDALTFNNPTPSLPGIIAATPHIHRKLQARLAPPPATPA